MMLLFQKLILNVIMIIYPFYSFIILDNLVSNANAYQLKPTKEDIKDNSRRMSLTTLGTNFL